MINKANRLIFVFMCFVAMQVRAQSVLYVTSLGDNGPGTLRQQVINAFPGDTIKFQVTGTIFLSTGRIEFLKNLVIEGPGMNNLIIRPSSPDRIFRFVG
uniref:hypothetical protein n=1 Tax=Fluviicola sp. TaxID=1917219 RepID=UPI002623F01E